MSLITPEKIRILQRKLCVKAKAEPAFRFYVLYEKIYREDILLHGYRLVRANAGAPGVDGLSFARIEDEGLEARLAGLAEELVSKTDRPDPVRRVRIPKPDGGERPLGIPTIRDRVVQSATELVLEPIFDVRLEENTFGYRPQRGAVDAVRKMHQHICLPTVLSAARRLSLIRSRHCSSTQDERSYDYRNFNWLNSYAKACDR